MKVFPLILISLCIALVGAVISALGFMTVGPAILGLAILILIYIAIIGSIYETQAKYKKVATYEIMNSKPGLYFNKNNEYIMLREINLDDDSLRAITLSARLYKQVELIEEHPQRKFCGIIYDAASWPRWSLKVKKDTK